METGSKDVRTHGKEAAGGPSEVGDCVEWGGQSCSWLVRHQLVDQVTDQATQSSSTGKASNH